MEGATFVEYFYINFFSFKYLLSLKGIEKEGKQYHTKCAPSHFIDISISEYFLSPYIHF